MHVRLVYVRFVRHINISSDQFLLNRARVIHVSRPFHLPLPQARNPRIWRSLIYLLVFTGSLVPFVGACVARTVWIFLDSKERPDCSSYCNGFPSGSRHEIFRGVSVTLFSKWFVIVLVDRWYLLRFLFLVVSFLYVEQVTIDLDFTCKERENRARLPQSHNSTRTATKCDAWGRGRATNFVPRVFSFLKIARARLRSAAILKKREDPGNEVGFKLHCSSSLVLV